MNTINVKNLSKEYKYHEKNVGLSNSFKSLFHRETLLKKAVNNISFSIDSGEFVGFLGPNGAGKTTTLKMLSGILYPTSGEVEVYNYIPWERKKEFKRRFSIVMGQKNQLWWDLPANESFYLNKCIYEIEDKEYERTISELAELLDVKHLLKVQVRTLSLGERMKMEIIAALIHKPDIIFLDEPTIGLDIVSQRKVREFLKYYNESRKVTIILTSHYMKDIEDLCKRTIVINGGELVFDGESKDMNGMFNRLKIVKLQLANAVAGEEFERYGKLKDIDGMNISLEVPKDNIENCVRSIYDNYSVVDLNISDVPLEEGLLKIYGKGTNK